MITKYPYGFPSFSQGGSGSDVKTLFSMMVTTLTQAFQKLASIGNNNTSYLCPTGMIAAFGANPGVSWVQCNGAPLNRVAYSDLYTAIGTTYGVGDGHTTFNVPTISTTPLTYIKT